MLAALLTRFGLARTTLLVTLASVAASVLVAAGAMLLVVGRVTELGLALSAAVPALCAPLFTWAQLRLIVELQRARRELEQLAVTDELSQAYTRRHFLELADHELARAARYGTPCSVVVFDLDGFTELNEVHGRAAGDAMLRLVGETCRATIRAYDVFARLGGEEFVIMLPSTPESGALEIAERLRRRLADHTLLWAGERIGVTASFGVASLGASMPRLDPLLRWADQAMHVAKRNGRNGTCVARGMVGTAKVVIENCE